MFVCYFFRHISLGRQEAKTQHTTLPFAFSLFVGWAGGAEWVSCCHLHAHSDCHYLDHHLQGNINLLCLPNFNPYLPEIKTKLEPLERDQGKINCEYPASWNWHTLNVSSYSYFLLNFIFWFSTTFSWNDFSLQALNEIFGYSAIF